MAEPPPSWAAPGEDPDDSDRRPGTPPAAPLPATPQWGTAPPPPPARTGWDTPPEQQRPAGWGPPPGWGGPPPPATSAAQPAGQQPPPSPWGAQPPPPGRWGGPPGPGNGSWSSRGPGIVPLRPLAIGEIYDGAIRAIRSNPRTMVGFSAVVIALLTLLATAPQAWALATLLSSPLSDPNTNPEDVEFGDVADLVNAGGIAVLVNVLQFVVATTIVSGLLMVAVDGAVRGRTLTPGELWSRCRSRLPAVLGLAVLILLAMPLFVLVGVVPGVIVLFLPSGETVGAILIVLGLLAGVAAFVAFYFGFWAVSAPALLLENLGVVAALRRSYRLVRGSFWRVFGIGLLTAVIAGIVRQLFTVPFSLVGGLVADVQNDDGFTATLVQLLITDIGTVLAGAVLFPFTAGVAALLYLDLRMRREGLDVDLMRS